MRTIHKYPLEIVEVQEIVLPQGAKPLTVQLQNDVVCLWAEVELNNKTESKEIRCFGTGHNLRDNQFAHYLGTTQHRVSSLVFHWYIL